MAHLWLSGDYDNREPTEEEVRELKASFRGVFDAVREEMVRQHGPAFHEWRAMRDLYAEDRTQF